jgi:hypothetical protein
LLSEDFFEFAEDRAFHVELDTRQRRIEEFTQLVMEMPCKKVENRIRFPSVQTRLKAEWIYNRS